MKDNFITPGHVRAFQAITSQRHDNITLCSCRINGEPGVAIVVIDRAGENELAIVPLFVAITPGMDLAFEGADERSGGDEGGPERSAAREFAVNKEMMTGPDPG